VGEWCHQQHWGLIWINIKINHDLSNTGKINPNLNTLEYDYTKMQYVKIAKLPSSPLCSLPCARQT
jgi:hypothetical protein